MLTSLLTDRRKFLVALITALLVGLNTFGVIQVGDEAAATQEIINVILVVLGAFGVERIGNVPRETS